MIRNIRLVLLSLVMLTACQQSVNTPPAPSEPVQSAEEVAAASVLFDFFGALEAGEYTRAVSYFGGSYEVLEGYNPTVDPADTATLFRNACSINGFSCLNVRDVVLVDRPREGEFVFDVTFSTREGNLFTLGPCCGASEEEQPTVSVFPVRVVGGVDGRYRVVDLPPYRP